MAKRKFFIIAAENSGDALGARIMEALLQKDKEIEFIGIGGDKMEALGLKSLFDMKQLSVMGFFEVLPHIPKFIKLINETAKNIINSKTDLVITIDAPDFCFRVAKKIKALEARPKLIHVVAPSVWAYRPKRAAKIAKIYDHLLTLLPFEPPYFEKEGLEATFIGHPVIEEGFEKGNREEFRKKYNIKPNEKLILVMPGSRRSEVAKLMNIFSETLKILKSNLSNVSAVIAATPRFYDELNTLSKTMPVKTIVVSDKNEKIDAYSAADAGIIKSGTSAVEVAIAGLPMVVAYKVSPISAFIARMVLKTKFANLINIILQKEVVPELLQEKCEPNKIADEVIKLIENRDVRENQKASFIEAVKMLASESGTPSEKAAEIILSYIKT